MYGGICILVETHTYTTASCVKEKKAIHKKKEKQRASSEIIEAFRSIAQHILHHDCLRIRLGTLENKTKEGKKKLRRKERGNERAFSAV